MKTGFSKCTLLAGFAIGLALGVQGVPISGRISLTGDGTDLGDGPNGPGIIHAHFDASVEAVSGSYAHAGVTAGTMVNRSSFTSNPWLAAGVIPFWMTTAGPAASFDLTSQGTARTEDGVFILQGEGMLHLAGYDPTPGFWLFRSWHNGTTFLFGSPDSVPDGGATALFLGAVVAGLALLRHQLLPAAQRVR